MHTTEPFNWSFLLSLFSLSGKSVHDKEPVCRMYLRAIQLKAKKWVIRRSARSGTVASSKLCSKVCTKCDTSPASKDKETSLLSSGNFFQLPNHGTTVQVHNTYRLWTVALVMSNLDSGETFVWIYNVVQLQFYSLFKDKLSSDMGVQSNLHSYTLELDWLLLVPSVLEPEKKFKRCSSNRTYHRSPTWVIRPG